MRTVINYCVSAFLLVVIQIFILNRLSLGYGIYIMLPPVLLIILPFRMKLHYLMIIAFGMGLIMDVFMNTYGLHASSLVLIAYLRPVLYQFFSPSDEYTRGENTHIYATASKAIAVLFSMLLIHHFWFFTIESFSVDNYLYTLLRIGLSTIASFIACVLTFFLFFAKDHVAK